MRSTVYIFGYQSMLAQSSIASSIGDEHLSYDYIPALLDGYIRNWSAIRNFDRNVSKRYVHVNDWSVAEKVAFANLFPASGRKVNGVCHQIPSECLSDLDFREQGYARVEVSDRIQPYPGYVINNDIACYTYIDQHPDLSAVTVSRNYYNMGWHGAQSIDRIVHGFSRDYIQSTTQPLSFTDDLAFTFISQDGMHLWLLNESDSSLVLLLKFREPQFTDSNNQTAGNVPELLRPVTKKEEWLDIRNPNPSPKRSSRLPWAMGIQFINNYRLMQNTGALAKSNFWLCRLAATQASDISSRLLDILSNDRDCWVSRAARLRMNGTR